LFVIRFGAEYDGPTATRLIPPVLPADSRKLSWKAQSPLKRLFSAANSIATGYRHTVGLEYQPNPSAERAAWLDEVCAGQAELRAEVEALLSSHEAGSPMRGAPRRPDIEAELARLKPEETGEMVGPYKLREQVGEGGFGTVWVADQERPVRRRVPLLLRFAD